MQLARREWVSIAEGDSAMDTRRKKEVPVAGKR